MSHGQRIIRELIDQLVKLPGIGEKSATRLALHILKAPLEDMEGLARAIIEAKRRVRLCSRCRNFSEEDPCSLCTDPRRDNGTLCVVEDPADMMAIEASGGFRGRYHILHGVLSPLRGVGPEEIKLDQLISRISEEGYKEVIVATNPSVEGEATSLYIADLLKPLGVKVTRIAYGLPAGGDVQYADKVTLEKAIENRREL
jgi:recombination protein RecR